MSADAVHLSPAVLRQASVADLALCETVIDARSPAEFALDHIPGAINCPVLSDHERVIVGTIYKQRGAFEARRVGGAMVAANLAVHLREVFADKPRDWKPIVYCWRGGLRSGAMTQWLRLVGWDARQLSGGIKQWRKHVIALIERVSPRMDVRVLCGPTGSAKTRILHALADAGAQTLDLEDCANHKGSVLGGLPGIEQPSQKQFETRIAMILERVDPSRPLYVEAESRKIGRLAVPTPLLSRLRESPCIAIDADTKARVDYLLRDYAYLGDARETFVAQLGLLCDLHSNETIARWQGWARSRTLDPLFAELLELHYDPQYARSQHRHLQRLSEAKHVEWASLDDAELAALCARIIEFG